jgi:hypothetical protein
MVFTRAARSSGRTLGEIRSAIAFRDRSETPRHHVRALIDQRANGDRAAHRRRAVTANLTRLARRARLLDPGDCDTATGRDLPLIATPAG